MDYSKLKINNLKDKLKEYGLSSIGTKQELLNRLKEYEDEHNDDDDNDDNDDNDNDNDNNDNDESEKTFDIRFETVLGKYVIIRFKESVTLEEMKEPLGKLMYLPPNKMGLYLKTKSPTYVPKNGDHKNPDGSYGMYILDKMLKMQLKDFDGKCEWYFDVTIRF